MKDKLGASKEKPKFLLLLSGGPSSINYQRIVPFVPSSRHVAVLKLIARTQSRLDLSE